MSKAQELQVQLMKLCPISESASLSAKWRELDDLLMEAQAHLRQIKLIHRNTYTHLTEKIKKIRNCTQLIEKNELKNGLKTLDAGREIAPGITLPAIEVPSAEFVPDVPLYYIVNTKEWGVRIGGTLISGTIGDFASPHEKKHLECTKRNCRGCPRWHHRGPTHWLPSMWLYTTQPLKAGNSNMRHIGSRATLLHDIKKYRDETNNRSRQTAHDMLIQLSIGHVL